KGTGKLYPRYHPDSCILSKSTGSHVCVTCIRHHFLLFDTPAPFSEMKLLLESRSVCCTKGNFQPVIPSLFWKQISYLHILSFFHIVFILAAHSCFVKVKNRSFLPLFQISQNFPDSFNGVINLFSGIIDLGLHEIICHDAIEEK